MEPITPSGRGLSNTIFRNTAFVTAGNLVLKALSFMFGILVIRRLGDNRYGQYATVLAFVGLFQIFAEMGITQYVMREIARDRSQTKKYFWNLIALRLLLAFANMLIIPVLAKLYGYEPDLVLGTFLYTLTFIFAAIEAAFLATLTANEHLEYISIINVSGQIAFMILGSIFLFGNLGFLWLVIAGPMTYSVRLGIGVWAVRKHKLLPRPVSITPQIWPELLQAGVPFGIIALTVTIANSIDTVMLSKSQPDYVVGWYNVAYGLILSLTFLTNGFKDAIVPSLTRAHADGPSTARVWYHHTTRFFLAFSIPLAAGGMLLASKIIVFLYTDEYLPAALAFGILAWDIPFLMYAGFCGRMTTVISEEKAAARIYTVNALANVVLNLIMIPLYGMIGAAIVTVVTDIISALQFYWLLREKLLPPSMKSHLIRIVLASFVMSLSVWATNNFNLFVQTLIGALVYFIMILMLRLPDETEWGWIRNSISKLAHFMKVKTT
jgi:O-antigen/teichoic acid export membrane protein